MKERFRILGVQLQRLPQRRLRFRNPSLRKPLLRKPQFFLQLLCARGPGFHFRDQLPRGLAARIQIQRCFRLRLRFAKFAGLQKLAAWPKCSSSFG